MNGQRDQFFGIFWVYTCDLCTWKCDWAWGSPRAEVKEGPLVESSWIIFKTITWPIIPGWYVEFNTGIINLQRFLVCPNAQRDNMKYEYEYFVCVWREEWEIGSNHCFAVKQHTAHLKEASIIPLFHHAKHPFLWLCILNHKMLLQWNL